MKCINYLLVFMLVLMLNGNLNAQEASSENEKPSAPETVITDGLGDEGEELDEVLESPDATGEDDVDEGEADEDEDAVDEDAVDEDEVDEDAIDDDGEAADEADNELDEDELDEAEERENSPISIRVNEDGEFVGQAKALVNGQWLPVEATIALVSDDVLLDKIVAGEDGSFSFPDIVPGSYKVYGTAASYCGRREVTVLPESGCCDNVDLSLRQDSPVACYSELGSAPAATFSQGPSVSGGFASGGGGGFASGGGGGFAGGGGGFAGGGGVASGGTGVASGVSGLRLLAVGGIVTAIAIPASDDGDVATPSE